jgi:hypothetical protein
MEIRQVFTKVEEDKTRDTGLLVTEECQMFITEEVGYYSISLRCKILRSGICTNYEDITLSLMQ